MPPGCPANLRIPSALWAAFRSPAEVCRHGHPKCHRIRAGEKHIFSKSRRHASKRGYRAALASKVGGEGQGFPLNPHPPKRRARAEGSSRAPSPRGASTLPPGLPRMRARRRTLHVDKPSLAPTHTLMRQNTSFGGAKEAMRASASMPPRCLDSALLQPSASSRIADRALAGLQAGAKKQEARICQGQRTGD